MKEKDDPTINDENQETRNIFEERLSENYSSTSRMFAILMPLQWIASIFISIVVSPQTWKGTQSSVHPHIWAAIIFGGLITLPPVFLALKFPCAAITRYLVASSQMLMSALLIHLTGGRIETHFHIFGSLAFLSFYRDWRVLIPATAVTAADHIFRGWFYPQSLYGVLTGGEWRWIEHAGWVVFEDIFLIISCRSSLRELWKTAENETALLRAHDLLEHRVTERTAELVSANEAMVIEVNERVAIENQLSTIRKFLLGIIDNVPTIISVKNEEGKYTLANRALSQLYGVGVVDIIGKTDVDLAFDKVEAMKIQNDDEQVLRDWKEKNIFEEQITDSKGIPHWLNVIKRPLYDVSGVKSVVSVCTDLTERKILESQLRHGQKLETIGQLAAGIAHEINTPTQYVGDNTRFIRDAFVDINSVLAKFSVLLEAARGSGVSADLINEVDALIKEADLEYITEEVPTAVQQSLDGISRIAKIVQSMKDFAHPGSKDKKAADINRAIESTVTVARNEWKYVADLETDFDPNLPPVPCLLGEFNQVILNIVTNAAHAIADVVGDGGNGKGKIKITTTKTNDDWAEIRVSDTGTGIPDELRSRIFDPFFTTKEVGKGTGQGLAISHSVIVEKHKGKLDIETAPGHGTTFIIQLPLNGDAVQNSNGGNKK